MTIELRPMRPQDIEPCGRICYEAFKDIAEKHNFRPDFPSAEMATGLIGWLFSSPGAFNVVAESDGQVIGSNHLWEWSEIPAVGPITIDPKAQAKGAGRKLMQAVIERGKDRPGIRLVQDSFNAASLSLYASLGFDVRDPLVLIEGAVKGEVPAGYEVRPMREEDHEACADLCRSVLGFDRMEEIKNAPPFGTPYVALRDGHITAYTSSPQMWPLNHAVAENEDDIHALLIGAGNQSEHLSFLLATRQTDLFRWCLNQKMRVVKPMTLMSMGDYREPRGCYLPSVGY